MSDVNKVQQTADYVVKLLPTVERAKARKLADLIVNHPDVYPDNSFSFDECAAFVYAKYEFNDTQRHGK